MTNLKELRGKLRTNLNEELTDTDAFSEADQVLSAFDRAWADTVTDLVDGNAAPEPKKRGYTRKPKPATSTPPAE